MSWFEVEVLDRSWWDRIRALYERCDDDFLLPLSMRSVGINEMMGGVFHGTGNGSGEYLGVVRDGEVLACGGYRPLPEGEAEIHGVVVHPDHRRKGLGKRVAEELIGRIAGAGFRNIHVGTWEGSPGLRLFEDLGFRETGRYDDPGKRPAGVRTVRLTLFM